MRHRIHHDINTHRIRLGRGKIAKILVILALALPAIAQICIVHHHDHQPPVLIKNTLAVRLRTVLVITPGPALISNPCGLPFPETAQTRHLRHLLDIKHNVKQLVIQRNIHQRKFIGRQHLRNLVLPISPCIIPPEIIHQQKTTTQQIIAQPLLLGHTQSHPPHLEHINKRILKHLGIIETHNHMLKPPIFCAIDIERCNLRQPQRKILIRLGIIHRPTAPSPPISPIIIARIIRILDTAKRKRIARENIAFHPLERTSPPAPELCIDIPFGHQQHQQTRQQNSHHCTSTNSNNNRCASQKCGIVSNSASTSAFAATTSPFFASASARLSRCSARPGTSR